MKPRHGRTEEKQMTDSERLDWLEKMALEPNGILLHSETVTTGRLGLGLSRPKRSLREAIDQTTAFTDGKA